MKLNKQTILFKTPRGVLRNFPKISEHFYNFSFFNKSSNGNLIHYLQFFNEVI